MAGPSNIEATDTESLAYLRDPGCGIPFDVHFEIEVEEGCSVGVVGGHKAVLALKSPVFKAMLFGPLAERGDPVKIRKTSMFAFKEMLAYMHEDQTDWRPWSLDLRELFRMADLAERYNLPGLKKEVVDYAEDCLYPKERLLEIARLAEDFHVFTELSETLLNNCSWFLTAILETPDDHNNLVKEWSGKDPEDMATALRLLARLDHWELAYVKSDETSTQKIISHLRHIDHSILPRQRLQQLRMMLAEDALGTIVQMIRFDFPVICSQKIFSESLRICQMKDEEKAAQEGVPLTLDTQVESGFTHGDSILLHLGTISLVATVAESVLCNKQIDDIWETMLGEESNSIPGAKSLTLTWFDDNHEIMDRDHLAEKLRSAGDNVKELPEYNDACDVFM